MSNRHVGSTFAELLAADGTLDAVDAVAQKRVLAWQIETAMRRQGMSKAAMARRLRTSRAAVDRLLDPENASVTLLTLSKVARAVGRRLHVRLAVR